MNTAIAACFAIVLAIAASVISGIIGQQVKTDDHAKVTGQFRGIRATVHGRAAMFLAVFLALIVGTILLASR